MAGCGLDVTCYAGNAAKGLIGDAIDQLADAVLEGVTKALTSLGSIWVQVPTPQLVTAAGGTQASEPVAFLQGAVSWYVGAFAVLAVLLASARMAWERRAEPGHELLKGLARLTLVSGAGLAMLALAVTASDKFSTWILNRSTQETDFAKNIMGMVALTSTTAPGFGPLIVTILGLVAIVASFMQIMLMAARGGLLVILAGTLPLWSSGTSTPMGKQWYQRALGWTFAFVLYKPAAAIIYATAFKLTGSDVFGEDGLTRLLTGIALMILALVAFPALMRFTVPMVAAASTSGGGGAGGAAAGAAMALPSGAMLIGGMKAGAGAAQPVSGGSWGSGPPGAAGATGSGGSSGASGSPGGGPSAGNPGGPGASPGGSPNGSPGAPTPGGGAATGDEQGAPGSPVDAGAGAAGTSSGPGTGVAGAGGGAAGASSGTAGAGAAAVGPVGAAATAATQAVSTARTSAVKAAEGSTGEDRPTGEDGPSGAHSSS